MLFSDVTSAQRRTLIAASLGWALDAFDVMLYAMVVAYVMRDLHIDKATVGFLNTLTLLASGIGGLLFGWIADRVGRTRALMLSIATIFALLVRLRTFDLGADAGGRSLCTRSRHGRRMEYRRDPGCGDLADRTARESDCGRAKLLGVGIRRRCARGRLRAPALSELAICFLSRNRSGTGHPLDSQFRP